MKIGILGCGYVGQAAAQYWMQQGHQVAVTTRSPQKVSALQSIASQVHLLQSVNDLTIFIHQLDCLIVCIAPQKNESYFSTYLETALNIAQILNKSTSLSQIIYTSSTSVYGDHQGNWVTENSDLFPLNENGKILIETENVFLSFMCSTRSICIFRLSEIYGPQREMSKRLKQLDSQALPGNGESYTNMIHLTDIVEALNFAIKKNLSGIYNLCNDFHQKRKDFYDQICKLKDLPPIKWDPSKKSIHGGNRRIDNQKIKLLGFQFSHHNPLLI